MIQTGFLFNYSKFFFKGLEESLKYGSLIQENKYEAEGSIKIPKSNGPFKGRMNASCQVSSKHSKSNFNWCNF